MTLCKLWALLYGLMRFLVDECTSLAVARWLRAQRCLYRQKAYRHVVSNGGSPGIDGMMVKELGEYLQEHWPELREALIAGHLQPVRRLNIPKPGGEDQEN